MKAKKLKTAYSFITALVAMTGFSSQVAARDLYWSEYGGVAGTAVIKAADIDGSNETLIFEGTEMASFIVDIAVTDDHIYWTGHSGGDVWRANRDGSEAGRIIEYGSGLMIVHNIAVDKAAGKLHIACHSNGIFQADLDGGNLSQVLGQTWTTNSAITVKASDEVLFVATNDANLYWYDPTSEWPFATSRTLEGGNQTYGLAYDPASDTTYYTVWEGAAALGALYSHNMATLETTLLRSDIVAPLGLKLSPDGSHLLIAQRGIGVGAVRVSDGGYQLIAPASAAHFGVAVAANPELDDPTFPPPPAEDGDVLFMADFEEDPLGEAPRTIAEGGVWATFSTPTDGSATVVEDTENVFGFGTENRFLRVQSVRNLNFQTNFEGTDVLTLGFDYIGRVYEGDGSRQVNVNLRTGPSNDDRVHLNQLNAVTGVVDGASYGGNDLPVRLETIVNNSTEPVTYTRPDGETGTLAPGYASLWIYYHTLGGWDLLRDEYQNVRHGSVELGDLMINLWFQADSGVALRSYDLDNVKVTKGAHLSELEGGIIPPPPLPYPEVPVLVVHEDFNQYPDERQILTAEDYLGPFTMNRVATQGSVFIRRDTGNRFGRGHDNLVMYWDNVLGTQLDIPIGGMETGVATVAFDMFHEGIFTAGETNRLGARFHAGTLGTGGITNNFGFQGDLTAGDYYVRGLTAAGRRLSPGYVQRWAVVTNNTRDPIIYETPIGSLELSASRTHVWVNGYLFNEEYSFGLNQTEQLITGFRFDAFNYWTAYIDNIRVWEGALVPDADVPPPAVEPDPRDLLVYEGFDYPEGSLIGRDGGIGWAQAYEQFDTFDNATVISPGLGFGDLPVEGNKVLTSGAARNFRTFDIGGIHSEWLNQYAHHIGRRGTSVWASALIQAVEPVGHPFMGFGFYRDTNDQPSEVIFFGKATGDQDAPERGWRVQGGQGSSTGAGLGTTGESGSATLFTGIPYEDLSFIVLRIDYGDGQYDRINVFHNPDPAGPAPTTGSTSYVGYIQTRVGSYGFDRIRIAGNEAGFHFDELRVGTNWQAVSGSTAAPSGFAAWAAANFPGVTDEAVIGPSANPSGNGVPNLIKYVLAMDPNSASLEGLPVQGTTAEDDKEYLTLTFATADAADDAKWEVLVSGSVEGDWTAGAVEVSRTPNGDSTTTWVYRDSVAIPEADGGRRFMLFSATLD